MCCHWLGVVPSDAKAPKQPQQDTSPAKRDVTSKSPLSCPVGDIAVVTHCQGFSPAVLQYGSCHPVGREFFVLSAAQPARSGIKTKFKDCLVRSLPRAERRAPGKAMCSTMQGPSGNSCWRALVNRKWLQADPQLSMFVCAGGLDLCTGSSRAHGSKMLVEMTITSNQKQGWTRTF